MSTLSKEEKCKLIAEALGWRWDSQRFWISPEGLSQRELPDFYTDEAASAMVLEAMSKFTKNGQWCELCYEANALGMIKRRLTPGWSAGLWKYSESEDVPVAVAHSVNSDRKTAIADAFVAWKQSIVAASEGT